MLFNKGYICTNCGPSPDCGSKTVKGVKMPVCKKCGKLVNKWERPLNERSGRCANCGHGSFKQAIVKGQFLRCCKHCEEVLNVDTSIVLRSGEIVRM